MVHFRCTRSWVARSPGNLVLVVVVVVLVVVSRGRPVTGTCYGARAYQVFFWLSLPVHSGSLKRIDYPKQICLAHPLSFECFHCS